MVSVAVVSFLLVHIRVYFLEYVLLMLIWSCWILLSDMLLKTDAYCSPRLPHIHLITFVTFQFVYAAWVIVFFFLFLFFLVVVDCDGSTKSDFYVCLFEQISYPSD